MSSSTLGRTGAVPADGPDVGVPAHYGDPLREQRGLDETGGWIDRSHRGVLRLSGPDRHSWLHSLTTQHLDPMPAGTGAEALVLSPQGHVEHHLVLADDGTSTWVDVEPGTAPALAGFLTSMRFMLRVDIEDLSESHGVVSVVGPDTTDALTRAGLDAGPTAYDVTTHDDVVVRRMPWPGVDAADLLVPRARLDDVLNQLDRAGLSAAGVWAFEASRVAAHRPRLGVDTDHKTLPHEVGWIETAVHMSKGCYRGQETVARVHNLGRPPRRLVLLHLDGSVESLPVPGDVVTDGGTVVGDLGTVARHHEFGPIALALVRRGTPVEANLTVGAVAATQEVVVDPEVGLHIKPTLR
jgi:folate-binding protein YgfZ